ncbi:MAG: aldo/keto reductase [Lentimonas sp.]
MIDRRTFLRQLAALAATSSVASAFTESDKLGKLLPTRMLGRTGQKISAFTLGGAHVTRAETELMSQKLIETAIELGCRSFDTARKYGEGRSELLFGKYLTPKYRDQVYIGTKTLKRTGPEVREELELSLRSMKLDYIDLWQVHSIRSAEDAEAIWNQGAIEEFLKAKQEGLVRHIGFTGHRDYRAHLRLLELLKAGGVQMDTCLMPINLVDPHYDSFITNVIPKLLQENYGIFAMKTFAHGKLIGVDKFGHKVVRETRNEVPTDTGITMKEMHDYVYSLPVTSLTSGCLFDSEVRQNIGNLTSFKGMTAAERDTLIARSTPFKGHEFEYYKA